jgi:hypothetical protein
MAVCLTVLFSFSSFMTLAASSLNEESAAMHCCHTKDKSCCRKSHHPNPTDGPTLSATACIDCSAGTLGSAGSMGYESIHLQFVMPAIGSMGRAVVSKIDSQSRTALHSLWQRPPPQNLLA